VIDPHVPVDFARLVSRDVIDLTGISKFFEQQAECAALFTEGIELKAPGHFRLKTPFREAFIQSINVWVHPTGAHSPREEIAYALRRYAEWYLRFRYNDRIRKRFAATQPTTLRPTSLRPSVDPIQSWEGFIGADGEFAVNPEKEGTPGIVAFQEIGGNYSSLALEVRGRDVGNKDPAFRKRLLKSALKEILLQLGLEQPRPGRPHDARRSESIAYSRDHQQLTKQKLAMQFCDRGQQRHTKQCFDRLGGLADSFYSVQKAHLAKLVSRQGQINS
jgi:hypothetical protein